MVSTTTARDRAEELVHSLQRRAREMVEAEERLVHTVRDLVEERGLSAGEVRKRLEDAVGRLKANAVWDRLRGSDAASALSDYRGELGRRMDDSVQRLLSTLPIVSKGDMKKLEQEVVSLRKKLESLRKKVNTRQSDG